MIFITERKSAKPRKYTVCFTTLDRIALTAQPLILEYPDDNMVESLREGPTFVLAFEISKMPHGGNIEFIEFQTLASSFGKTVGHGKIL